MLYWSNTFTNFHRQYVKKNIELWDEQRKTRTESFQHLNVIKTFGVENEFYPLGKGLCLGSFNTTRKN
jgi:ABC-type bacteriocin/lantibiotic exporter with double-glycine peptidase domain